MNLLLIAGHGAGDPGAVSTINGVQYKESELTRDLVSRVKAILSEYTVVVDIYDMNRNAFSDSKTAILKSTAKFDKYDYVLEIHFNAYKAESSDGSTKGVEIYYPSLGKQSGLESAICANIAGLGLRNRGTKKGNYSVINTAASYTKANLLETCFIDDPDDMSVFLKSRYSVANAISKAIISYFKLSKGTSSTTIKPETFTVTLSTVQDGSRGNTVKALQVLLNGNGCSVGSADGIAGTKTVSGIKNYQKKQGMSATGVAGLEVFNSLLK